MVTSQGWKCCSILRVQAVPCLLGVLRVTVWIQHTWQKAVVCWGASRGLCQPCSSSTAVLSLAAFLVLLVWELEKIHCDFQVPCCVCRSACWNGYVHLPVSHGQRKRKTNPYGFSFRYPTRSGLLAGQCLKCILLNCILKTKPQGWSCWDCQSFLTGLAGAIQV